MHRLGMKAKENGDARRNAPPGWSSVSSVILIDKMHNKVHDLIDVLDGDNDRHPQRADFMKILSLTADIGNYAMMIADKYCLGGWKTPEGEGDGDD